MKSKITSLFEYADVTVVVISYYLILFLKPFSLVNYLDYRIYASYSILIIAVASICMRRFIFCKESLVITNIDLGVYVFLATIIFSRFNTYGVEPLLNETTINLIIGLLFYSIFRLVGNKISAKTFTLIILPSVLIQIFVLLEGYLTYRSPGMPYMLLKGTLGNSGLCAAFITVLSPILIQRMDKNKMLQYAVILFVLSLLFILRSRASIIAVVPIAYYFIMPDKNPFIFLMKSSKLFKLTVCLILLVGSFALYAYKKNSAIGRLFIWKIGLENSPKSFFTGTGYGEFPEKFKDWQGKYFRDEGINSPEAQLADLPSTAFSEPIQIFIEQGLLGLLLFVLIIFFVARFKCLNKEQSAYRLSLLASFIISLFSYPYHSMPIIILTFISLAIIGGFELSRIENKIPLRITFVLVSLLLTIASFHFWVKARHVRQLNERLTRKELHISFESEWDYLKTNPFYLTAYGKSLFLQGKFLKSIDILERARRQSQDVGIDLQLAKVNQILGRSEQAKSIYLGAINSIPKMMTPKYLLFRHYIELKDTSNAVKLGEIILIYPVKIHSPKTMMMQDEVSIALLGLSKMSVKDR